MMLPKTCCKAPSSHFEFECKFSILFSLAASFNNSDIFELSFSNLCLFEILDFFAKYEAAISLSYPLPSSRYSFGPSNGDRLFFSITPLVWFDGCSPSELLVKDGRRLALLIAMGVPSAKELLYSSPASWSFSPLNWP